MILYPNLDKRFSFFSKIEFIILKSVSDIFEIQVTQSWANIIALLNEGNMGVDDLVKINGFVVGAENFPAYAAARKEVLGEAKPASTAIIVPALAMPNWLVEIEVIAAR